jgi:hypothetical protein
MDLLESRIGIRDTSHARVYNTALILGRSQQFDLPERIELFNDIPSI